MPRGNKIQIRTGSATPSAADFATSEPAWDSSAGKLYVKSAAGSMVEVGINSLATYTTAANFPGTGLATVLYLATDSSKIYQWNGVYVEVGVASGYTLPNATSSVLGGVVVGAGLSVSSGTVSANIVSVAGRTGTVTISSGDVSGLGSLATANSVAYSSLTGTPSTFSPSSHASSHASGGADAISISSSQVTGLPTAGTASTNYCAGDDARLTDSRTPAAHAASHATGGSDAITAANIGAAATSHVHAATDITSGTLADAMLSSNIATYATMAASFNTPSNAVDIYPRGEAYSAAIPVTSGYVRAVFFTPTRTMTVSSITMASGSTLAAGLTTAQMALYSFNETTATLLARTASDTSLFTASETSYSRSFLESGGYPATYTLQAGSRYAVGAYLVGTTMPTLFGKATAVGGSAITPRTAGLSTFSATLLTSWTVTANIYLAWARLS